MDTHHGTVIDLRVKLSDRGKNESVEVVTIRYDDGWVHEHDLREFSAWGCVACRTFTLLACLP